MKKKDWLTDEGLIKIEGWARHGLTLEEISKKMGVARNTLSNWQKEEKRIYDALKKGKEVVDFEVENALLTKARGGDVIAQMFWLKNRRPDLWLKENQKEAVSSTSERPVLPDITKCWGGNFDGLWRLISQNSYDSYFLKGGRGSGKSSFISLAIVRGLIEDPRANAIIYRKVGNTIGESVFTQIGWAISRLGLDGLFRKKVSPYRYILEKTGQEIIFKGCDDPVKSKSIKPKDGFFRFCWFEELSEFDGMEEMEMIVQSIARSPEGRTAILCSYNPPKSAQNWLNSEVLIPKQGRFVHHSTYLDIAKELIGEQFIRIAEETRRTNETKYRHVYLGEVTGTGGEVFDNVETKAFSPDEIKKFDYIYSGIDFGFAVDPAAIVQCSFNRTKKELYIFNEFYKTGATTEELAERLQEMGNPYTVADSAEPRTIHDLKGYGCKVIGAKKGPGSVEHGIKFLQDLNKIIIDPERCPNAAREFCGYEYDLDKYGNYKSIYPDKNNHAIDAVRYALEDVFRNNNIYSM